MPGLRVRHFWFNGRHASENPPAAYSVPAAAAPEPARREALVDPDHVGGILFGFIPPLVVFLVLKDRSAFVRQHAATTLNFQITMAIVAIVGVFLWIVLVGFLSRPPCTS